MMFQFSKFILAALAFIFAGQVAAAPMPMPLQRSLVGRMDPVDALVVKRLDINTFPEASPAMVPSGVIQAFHNGKRTTPTLDINTFPEASPAMAPSGVIQAFHNGKRADLDINTFPEASPAMAPSGVIQAFHNGKRQNLDINTFPAQSAAMAPSGVIEPFHNKRGNADIDAILVATPIITPAPVGYGKRADLDVNTFPAASPAMAPSGVIEAFHN
ncbi:uncharacterized protein FIBRA_01028 [Fibroporia radiculosa]|uniref:Cupin type-1 domain-containing protein n=1 Tax=Fibroporia radiculosa TaxID=599839 RepID=J4H0V7_9APHY|nr:uncharacterized protein FIBRA_01028 [Fibroporia radiculosa]CCL99019.1 predicted protein [Fibroporia radiculosa]